MAISTRKPIFTSSLFERQAKVLRPKDRSLFLKYLAELLTQGFSVQQALHFMALLLPQYAHLIDQMQAALEKGESFERALEPLGYSIHIVANLFYAQRQGRFLEALHQAADFLRKLQEYQQKFIKVLVYPAMMLVFLVALLFGMRSFLLPHIASFIQQDVYDSHLMVRMLVDFFSYLPQITLLLVGLSLVVLGLGNLYLFRLRPLKRYQLLVQIPFIQGWVRSYCSYQLAEAFGNFFLGGYSMQQTLDTLVRFPIEPLLADVGEILETGFKEGRPLVDLLAELDIFTQAFPLVIQQGELISQTAAKCQMYAQTVFRQLMEDIERKIQWVQPILFIFIAMLVLAMYLLIMLPMFTMEGL